MELRATILRNGNGKNIRYFDKNGEELFEGDYILDGSRKRKRSVKKKSKKHLLKEASQKNQENLF